jgi:hypothetical protein
VQQIGHSVRDCGEQQPLPTAGIVLSCTFSTTDAVAVVTIVASHVLTPADYVNGYKGNARWKRLAAIATVVIIIIFVTVFVIAVPTNHPVDADAKSDALWAGNRCGSGDASTKRPCACQQPTQAIDRDTTGVLSMGHLRLE